MCKNMFYKNIGIRETIFCNLTNEMCAYQRYCSIKNKIILSERWELCKLNNKKNIPVDSKFIKLKLKGYLYIENGEQVIKVWNTLGEFNQEFVYVREGIIPNDYDLSLTPFEDKKNNRRRNNTDND